MIPNWVVEAGNWFGKYERGKDPTSFNLAPWLPVIFLEVMDEFEAAVSEERARRAEKK